MWARLDLLPNGGPTWGRRKIVDDGVRRVLVGPAEAPWEKRCVNTVY